MPTPFRFFLVPGILAVAVSLLSSGVAVAQPQVPHPPAVTKTNLLKLDDSISIVGKNLKIEQTKDGNIRVTGTNVSDIEDGDPAFEFYKTLSVTQDAATVTFQVSGITRPMLVSVFNEEGGLTYKHLVNGDNSLNLGTMKLKGSDGLFTGKVKRVEALIPIPKEAGEYVIEIGPLEILR